MTHAHRSHRGLARISALSLVAGTLLWTTSSFAGVALGVTPHFPPAVKVGPTALPASLEIKWLNTAPNDQHANNVTNIELTPSCGTFVNSSACPGSALDPGVLHIRGGGTTRGDCGGVALFTISVVDAPSGRIRFTPGFVIPVGGTCVISFTFDVVKLPTRDADPVLTGMQTAVLASAQATDVIQGSPGSGIGSTKVSFPAIVTTPGLGGTLGATPVNLSDTAVISGLVPDINGNLPTGTVTFSLFVPNDANCAGAAFQSQTVNLTNACTINGTSFLTTCATSSTFTANAAGTWHWTAVYGGNADNPSVSSACASEPVTVNRANPTIQTSPNPATASRLLTPLGDVADLRGGVNPTGEIAFTLYPPSDPTCASTPIFTNRVNVNGNGQYATSSSAPAALITSAGTYHWRASYNGDGNNNSVTSPCAAEPVVVTQPALSVAKTPDNSTISPGQVATFTIVVANNGPGVATNVTVTDSLPGGGGVNWTTATPTCTMAGAVGGQVLNCALGDLAVNASSTITVTAVTSFSVCTAMTNTATASAQNAAPATDSGSIACIPPPPAAIPTLREVGVILLALLLMASGLVMRDSHRI